MATGYSELGQVGRAYLDAGRWGEALECLEAAKDRQGVEKLAAKALEAGDLFVWRQCSNILGRDLNPHEIRNLHMKAETLGKNSFALAALALMDPPEDSQ